MCVCARALTRVCVCVCIYTAVIKLFLVRLYPVQSVIVRASVCVRACVRACVFKQLDVHSIHTASLVAEKRQCG